MEKPLQKWRTGLAKTRKSTFGKIASFLGASEIKTEDWDHLEEIFIQADVGVNTSMEIIRDLKEKVEQEGIIQQEDFYQAVRSVLLSRLLPPPPLNWTEKPLVTLIVGVNGSGKTTTLAKLGYYFQDRGQKVIFAAADTYRAAAVEQLQTWGKKLDIPVIAGQPEGDPGAVAYDAIQAGVSRSADQILIDTAGRLHTHYNLMEELKKVHRVAGKSLPGAPHQVWLVLDATTGQNALYQAEAFQEAVPLDGVILAKLDSSARGGMVLAVQKSLQLPVVFAGLGEKPQDLVRFDREAFIDGLLEIN